MWVTFFTDFLQLKNTCRVLFLGGKHHSYNSIQYCNSIHSNIFSVQERNSRISMLLCVFECETMLCGGFGLGCEGEECCCLLSFSIKVNLCRGRTVWQKALFSLEWETKWSSTSPLRDVLRSVWPQPPWALWVYVCGDQLVWLWPVWGWFSHRWTFSHMVWLKMRGQSQMFQIPQEGRAVDTHTHSILYISKIWTLVLFVSSIWIFLSISEFFPPSYRWSCLPKLPQAPQIWQGLWAISLFGFDPIILFCLLHFQG